MQTHVLGDIIKKVESRKKSFYGGRRKEVSKIRNIKRYDNFTGSI